MLRFYLDQNMWIYLTCNGQEAGTDDPIVLLHGNPTSSFLGREVIPELSGGGRRGRVGNAS